MAGTVEGIRIASKPGGAMESRSSVRAIAGGGLEGDRYLSETGTFSRKPEPMQNLTLIEAEAIEGANRDYRMSVAHEDTRRNILTRGIALNHLVGRAFSIGSVRLRGVELCEPCGHMENLCGREGVRKALIHRGGLRCEILEGGSVSIGDLVSAD